MNTTIEVSKEFARTWIRWRKHYGMTSVAFADMLSEEVKAQKQKVLYCSLPMPTPFYKRKSLEGVKIANCYRK